MFKISTNVEWYKNPNNWRQIAGIGRAYQGRDSFPYIVDDTMTDIGYTDWTKREMVLNPTILSRNPDEQFELMKGVAIHEACHRRFTQAPEDNGDQCLNHLWNLLEDGRIEKIMSILHPNVVKHLQQVSQRVYGMLSIKEDDPLSSVLSYSFRNRADVPDKYQEPNGLWDTNPDLWEQVKPLVDESFDAEDSNEVMDIAREILKVLGIPEEQKWDETGVPQCGHGSGERGLEDGDAEKLADFDKDEDGTPVDNKMDRPTDPDQSMIDPPTMDKKEEHPDRYHSNILRASDATRLWAEAVKLVPSLTKALEVQEDTEIKEVSRSGGKLKVQQWIKHPEIPFKRSTTVKGLPPIAVSVIVDCSTSMYEEDTSTHVAELAMGLYEACRTTDTTLRVVTAPGNILACDNNTLPSQALPLLAGLSHPWATYEQIDTIINLQADWLREQPEKIKLIFCLHDGMSNDRRKVRRSIEQIAKDGIKVIAVGLGIRSTSLSEQFGKGSYVQMDNVSRVGAMISQVISNLRRR